MTIPIVTDRHDTPDVTTQVVNSLDPSHQDSDEAGDRSTARQSSNSDGGKPPLLSGLHRVGVIRMMHLP